MIDRAEHNPTTTQLYNTENYYPPQVGVASSRPSSLPLMAERSVSVVGMLCSGSPCAPLHTSLRCGSIHSRGRCNAHRSMRNTLLLCPLHSPCSPLRLLVWASSLVESCQDARSTFTTHSEDKWSVSRQLLACLATSILIGQEVDCIQKTVQLGPVGSGVVGNLLAEHGVICLPSSSVTSPGLT